MPKKDNSVSIFAVHRDSQIFLCSQHINELERIIKQGDQLQTRSFHRLDDRFFLLFIDTSVEDQRHVCSSQNKLQSFIDITERSVEKFKHSADSVTQNEDRLCCLEVLAHLFCARLSKLTPIYSIERKSEVGTLWTLSAFTPKKFHHSSGAADLLRPKPAKMQVEFQAIHLKRKSAIPVRVEEL